MSRHAITHRLDTEALHTLYRGVYGVGHSAITLHGRFFAAVLACGPGSALSHRSGSELLEMLDPIPGPIHITRTGPHRDGPNGIVIHRTTTLPVGTCHDIPVTTPARTLVDLAATATTHDLERALERARVRRLVTEADLLDAVGHHRPGTGRLKELLEAEPTFTRSKAERALRRLVVKAQLPHPQTNVYIGPYELDALWREQRLVVEFDSWEFHGHREAFERDRIRDADLQAAGYRVIRATWRQLTTQPEALTARLAVAIARGPAAAGAENGPGSAGS